METINITIKELTFAIDKHQHLSAFLNNVQQIKALLSDTTNSYETRIIIS